MPLTADPNPELDCTTLLLGSYWFEVSQLERSVRLVATVLVGVPNGDLFSRVTTVVEQVDTRRLLNEVIPTIMRDDPRGADWAKGA